MERYETMSPLDYLRLNKLQRMWCRIYSFFLAIPTKFLNLIFAIGRAFKRLGLYVAHECVDVVKTFKEGDWKTRLSFIVMGFGCLARGQIVRGVVFLLFEIVFIVYLALVGVKYLSKLGLTGLTEQYTATTTTTIAGQEFTSTYVVEGDNTLQILVYSVLTIMFIIAFIYTWRLNVKQNKLAQQILATGKPLKSNKEDLQSVVDNQFHKTVLALPMLGIVLFTVMPIIVMIMVAFTNFDGTHTPPTKLFEWVGLENFTTLFSFTNGSSRFVVTFGEILTWTFVWAFFATFTNYFLGMFVAMMINKKGIKFKKVWRTILVVTIAVPQFISLLFVSHMFDQDGIVNGVLMSLGWIESPIAFWKSTAISRVLVIVINIWVGIPYLMLITTGILMNIPADLYESARIDGANGFQMYCKITLPYMLFVTGPYLLTSFIGNMNNFNVIYLLTGGGVANSSNYKSAGDLNLLITWLFSLANDKQEYNTAAVLGIMIFVVVAIVSLIVYAILPSTRNEEDFQ